MDNYEANKVKTVRYHKVKKVLSETYGYETFRNHQYHIINSILSKQDVCAVLPTGHGKSICFQLPAIYKEMPAVIVSPLISLMDDQRHQLDELNITSCCWNSTVTDKAEMAQKIVIGYYQFGSFNFN